MERHALSLLPPLPPAWWATRVAAGTSSGLCAELLSTNTSFTCVG
jgi:hypothetical protein